MNTSNLSLRMGLFTAFSIFISVMGFQTDTFAIEKDDPGVLTYQFVFACSGVGTDGRPARAVFEHEYLDGQITASSRWRIEEGAGQWEIYSYGQVYGNHSKELIAFYPEEYNNTRRFQYSFTGVSAYQALSLPMGVRIAGSVTPNISADWRWQRSFDFRMNCKSAF